MVKDPLAPRIIEILCHSSWHMQTLQAVKGLGLPDWAIGAGFVRNLVWDHLHGISKPTPLADIDILIFERINQHRDLERQIETRLQAVLPGRPWSVRNQARMHRRNAERAYRSIADAISFWLETPTCVAASLTS